MNTSASEQVLVFFFMVLCGVLCGVLFDLFRGIRYSRKTPGGVVALQDLIFWVMELVLVYAVIFSLNYAYVRAFELVALVIGSVLYFMTVSPFVVSFISKLTCVLEKIILFVTGPVNKFRCFVKKKALFFATLMRTRIQTFADCVGHKIVKRAKDFLRNINLMNKNSKKIKK